MSKLYPFCLNSRRWIDVMFFLDLPKTCVAIIEGDVDCRDNDCPYFELREPTTHLLEKIRIMKLYGMDIITAEKERQ